MNMNELPKLNIIKVLRFTGDRKSATLADGRTVYRQKQLWMGKKYGLVLCADTTNHFIYHDPEYDQKIGEWPKLPDGRSPKKYIGRWTPICTCGSPAAIVGSNAYSQFASPTTKNDSTTPGQMIVCLALTQFGKHMDGSHD